MRDADIVVRMTTIVKTRNSKYPVRMWKKEIPVYY